MSADDLEEQVAAANAYEALHVPALFRQWPPRLLDAIGVAAGERVLDVACGTGVAAREAVLRVGSAGTVAGVDPGAGMLSVARQLAPGIDWREGVAEALPFDDGSFDAVISQFGLMFFQDRPGALDEMRRVLVPGGRISIAVWDSLDRSEAYPEAVGLLERLAGTDAADALRAPFVLGDHEALRSLFEDAGFDDVSIASVPGSARFPSIGSMVEADLRGWLPIMGVVLDEALIERILAEAENVLNGYVNDAGEAEFSAPAIIATGRNRQA